METVPYASFTLAGEELTVLNELLESERARLLVEIRHTDHRAYRDELRRRLTVLEHLIDCCRSE
jgi:hypothetical protein